MKASTYFCDKPVDISLAPGDVKAFTSRHSGRFSCPELNHPFDKLVFARHGEGALEQESEESALQPGLLLYLPAGLAHSFRDHSPLSLWGICFEGEQRGNLLEGLNPGPYTLTSPILQGQFICLVRDVIREEEEGLAFARERSRALLTDFLVELNRFLALMANNDPAAKMTAYLNRYFTQDISLDDLAVLTGLSRRRVTALFKKEKGCTIIEYLQRKRVGYACRELDDHGVVTLAAQDSGFNDMSHFFRVFKKLTGQTPGEYNGKKRIP